MTRNGRPTSPVVAVVANTAKVDPNDAATLRSTLEQEGCSVEWIPVQKGSAATKAVLKAMKAGADRVVVCGGDGTVRAAIQALAGTSAPLGVLPSGTANLFAGALHLPSKPEDVARAIAGQTTRVIDTAMCNDLAFAVMAGTGLDAAMIESADDDKERLGTVAYVRAGVSEARSRKPFEVTVKVDGNVFYEGDATCVLVGNLGTLKGGLEAFPDARPDDGLLDVAIVTAAGLRQWGSLVMSTALQRQTASRHVQFSQGEHVKVKMPKAHRFELDGGSKGSSKVLDYRIVPNSLHVSVA